MDRVGSSSIVDPLDLRKLTGVDISVPFSPESGVSSVAKSPFSSSQRSPEPFTNGLDLGLELEDFMVSFSFVFLPKLTAILGKLRRGAISGVDSPLLPTPSSFSSVIAPRAVESPSALAIWIGMSSGKQIFDKL